MGTSSSIDLKKLGATKIHFIGIGGSGMSGIARIMLAKGLSVSGSDKNDSAVIKSLRALGAEIFIGHNENNLKDCELVIMSSAISDMNPELAFAKSTGIPKEVTVTAGDKSFKAKVRIDTPGEADYYRHGGIMQYVLRQLRG